MALKGAWFLLCFSATWFRDIKFRSKLSNLIVIMELIIIKLFCKKTGGIHLNIERINAELTKTYSKIHQLQKRAKELEESKKQTEDMEYVKIIRKHGISAEDLQVMIELARKEQKNILETREENTEHEEQA